MNAHESIEMMMRVNGWTGFIAGCDEVGRGPLAGPATVACVVFPNHLDDSCGLFSKLDDSKKLTAKKRESLVDEIHHTAAAYAVIDMSPAEIDEYNILQACLLGMKRAVEAVSKKLNGFDADTAHVIVDGNKLIPNLGWPQTAYVKGDARSWSIAAASILAKVHRDGLMVEYDALYPGYGFAKNVGYPTALHRKAVIELGLTPIHRRSFKVKGMN